jgi:hypothetical protein
MGRSFFRVIYLVLLGAIPTKSQASEVVFRLNIGEETFEINCATNQARIRETSALVAGHEVEANRLRRLRRTKGLVEGENLLLLTLRFKIGFIRQNLALLGASKQDS